MHIRERILLIISYQLMQFSVCAHVDYMYVHVHVHTLLDVIDGRGLQLFLLHEDVSLQFYIPAVSR